MALPSSHGEGREVPSGAGGEIEGDDMAEEDVKRDGKVVRVTVGGVSAERTYSSTSAAKQAYLRLMFSKKARTEFFRPPRRDR